MSAEKQGNINDLIKVVPAYAKPSVPGKQVIIVDLENGEILYEMPVIRWLRKLKFYEVDTEVVILNIKGPDIATTYSSNANPFEINLVYDVRPNVRGLYQLIRTVMTYEDPLQAINKTIEQKITSFIFERPDFVKNFKGYETALYNLIVETGNRMGLSLNPKINIPWRVSQDIQPPAFLNCNHKFSARTKDGQDIEIEHTLVLTLFDEILFRLSRISNLNSWLKEKLEQFSKTALIDIHYADVLLDLREDFIKSPMEHACRAIGYNVKQLVTVPGLDIEKFYFETADSTTGTTKDFTTKDARLKVALNAIVSGKLDLKSSQTRRFIKPGKDIISEIRRGTVDSIKEKINNLSPEDCFLNSVPLEDVLQKAIRDSLSNAFGFTELDISIKFLETDLSERLRLLQGKSHDVILHSDWTLNTYRLVFRVENIAENGLFRFRKNIYDNTTEELNDIASVVKNIVENFILRTSGEISHEQIENAMKKARERVVEDFGLAITIRTFNQELTDEEQAFISIEKEGIRQRFERQRLIDIDLTQQLQVLNDSRLKILQEGEFMDEEELEKIDKKIGAIQKDMTISRDKLVSYKTDKFYLPENPGSSSVEPEKKDTDK